MGGNLETAPISIAGGCRLCFFSLGKLLPTRQKAIGLAERVLWYPRPLQVLRCHFGRRQRTCPKQASLAVPATARIDDFVGGIMQHGEVSPVLQGHTRRLQQGRAQNVRRKKTILSTLPRPITAG